MTNAELINDLKQRLNFQRSVVASAGVRIYTSEAKEKHLQWLLDDCLTSADHKGIGDVLLFVCGAMFMGGYLSLAEVEKVVMRKFY